MSNVEKSLALLGLPSEGTTIEETAKAYRWVETVFLLSFLAESVKRISWHQHKRMKRKFQEQSLLLNREIVGIYIFNQFKYRTCIGDPIELKNHICIGSSIMFDMIFGIMTITASC